MGVDLKLLPFHEGSWPHPDHGLDPWEPCTPPHGLEFFQRGSCYFTALRCFRRHELWPVIRALPSRPVPIPFYGIFDKDGDDEDEEQFPVGTQKDAYDDPLLCTTAADLLTLSAHESVLDNATNRAIWAYLRELPPYVPIALYWD